MAASRAAGRVQPGRVQPRLLIDRQKTAHGAFHMSAEDADYAAEELRGGLNKQDLSGTWALSVFMQVARHVHQAGLRPVGLRP